MLLGILKNLRQIEDLATNYFSITAALLVPLQGAMWYHHENLNKVVWFNTSPSNGIALDIKKNHADLENLESPGILLCHFPGLESPGKGPLVLESSGNLLHSTKNMKCMDGSKEN